MSRPRCIRALFPVLALVTSWALPPDRNSAASWPIPIDLPPELLVEVDAQVHETEVELVKTAELEGVLERPGRGAPPPVAYRYTPADVHAALRTASPRARCIVTHEVGGRDFDPYAIGSQGERGPVQLHPRGLLPLFTQWSSGAPPENPYAAIPFLEWALGQGYATHWSPARLGRC